MVGSALVAIPVLGVGVTFYWFYSTLPEEPQVQTEFWGLSLDSTKSDVRFLKGEPASTVLEDSRWVFKNEFNNSLYDFMVSFSDTDNTLESVNYTPSPGTNGSYPIQGINAGESTLEDVLEKFGEPSRMTTSNDGTRHNYSFDQYNVWFQLEKNTVTALGMSSQDHGKPTSESGDMESEP